MDLSSFEKKYDYRVPGDDIDTPSPEPLSTTQSKDVLDGAPAGYHGRSSKDVEAH